MTEISYSIWNVLRGMLVVEWSGGGGMKIWCVCVCVFVCCVLCVVWCCVGVVQEKCSRSSALIGEAGHVVGCRTGKGMYRTGQGRELGYGEK